jgi:hypothetical protein
MLTPGLANRLADWIGEGLLAERLRQWAKAQTQQAEINALATQAMQRARFNPITQHIQVTDIGLLAYRAPDLPKLHHSAPIPSDIRWLRPFIALTPVRPLQAVVQLSLLDSQGRGVFSEPQSLRLQRPTQIVTRHWLPLDGLPNERQGRWSLAAYYNGALMALHRFEWLVASHEPILEQVYEDGEISESLQRELRQGKFRKMSLDELLAGQKD